MVSRGKFILIVDADGATKFSEYGRLQDELDRILGFCFSSFSLFSPFYFSHFKDNTSKRNYPAYHGIVCGSRAHMQHSTTKKRGTFRNILMWGFHLVVKWIGGVKDIKDTQCGFKLFTRNTGTFIYFSICLKSLAL